jgi:hypothetical protein
MARKTEALEEVEAGMSTRDTPIFRMLGDDVSTSYEFKACPKCKQDRLQFVGYNPQDEGLEILHRCSGCQQITAYWDCYEEPI